MELPVQAFQPLGLGMITVLGLGLAALSLHFGFIRKSAFSGERTLHQELERLFSEIGLRLKMLPASGRLGSFLAREKQEEIGRMLADLQGRLRYLDEHFRLRYEARAGRLMVDAAKVGITLPPP
jgi:hypothetical protein